MGYNLVNEIYKVKKHMPILQYKCPKCGKEFEELVSKFDVAVNCPNCKVVAQRSYSGQMFSATGVQSKKCSGNCKTCGGCK
jgi:putative FmdB family regulatory protein